MADFSVELTEQMFLSDTLFLESSAKQDFKVTIGGENFTDNWSKLVVNERLNEPAMVEYELASGNVDDVSRGQTLKVFYADTQIYEFTVDTVEYDQDENVIVTGLQSGARTFRERDFRTLTNSIYRETSTVSGQNILDKIRSENVDGNSPFLLSTGTNDVTTSTTFRVEGDTNRLQATRHLAALVNSDFWFDLDGNNNPQVNMTGQRGSGSSVETFRTGGSNANVSQIRKSMDDSQLWNAIIVRGYAEGGTRIASDEKTDSTSINDHGRIEKQVVDTRIRNKTEANLMADKILAEHKEPVKKFNIRVDDESIILPSKVNVGDTVTVDEGDVLEDGEDTEYRVFARKLVFDDENGFHVDLELNSRTIELSEEVLNTIEDVTKELERARNQVVKSTVESSNTASTQTSPTTSQVDTTYVSAEVDSGQQSTSQGHGTSNKTETSDVGNISLSTEDVETSSVTLSSDEGVIFSISHTYPGNIVELRLEWDGDTSEHPVRVTIWNTDTSEKYISLKAETDLDGDIVMTTTLSRDISGDSVQFELSNEGSSSISGTLSGEVRGEDEHSHGVTITSTNEGGLVNNNNLVYDEDGTGGIQVATAVNQNQDTVNTGSNTDQRQSTDNTDSRLRQETS